MDLQKINDYIAILQEELVAALGCTEPIAIAYAAAKAKEVLGCFPRQVVLECSGNLIKNVNSVIVPNTGGLKGLEASLLAGLVGGKSAYGLEVLRHLTAADIVKIEELMAAKLVVVRPLATEYSLHLKVYAVAGDQQAMVEIQHAHTNVCRIEKNGRVIDQNLAESGKYLGRFTDRSILSVKDIYQFATTVELERVKALLTHQIDCNMAMAEHGMGGGYGVGIGPALLAIGHGKQAAVKMRAYAAAASEARMSGCAMPVVTNSGSGNQGITASVPVIVYAQEQSIDNDTMLRALILSNLLTIHQKTLIGRLSAFCGAVSAACSSGAAITYMTGGSLEDICGTITNMLANASGIICDGAKPSCAAKIATCLDAAYVAHHLAMSKQCYQAGDGIVKADVEATIVAVGHIARQGMQTTDVEILKVMLEC